jgi:branched-chain amino acid aminotransferase
MNTRRFKTVTTINGVRVPESRAKVSILDNALLYAEGLFETFLAIDDRVIFMQEHLARLRKGAAAIGLRLPVNRKTLAKWMVATVKAHPDRVKKLRLTCTSGEAARWVGVQGKPQVLLSASPHTLPEKPFKLIVSDWKVDQKSTFRQIKTVSNVIHAAAIKRAAQLGFDDAVMLNENNDVAEVTSANIFWARKGHVYTPPLRAGCLDGITRKFIIREARRLGFRVVEKYERPAGMLKAEEIFISSSLKLVAGVSVVAYNKKRYRFQPGEVTRLVAERIERLVLG